MLGGYTLPTAPQHCYQPHDAWANQRKDAQLANSTPSTRRVGQYYVYDLS